MSDRTPEQELLQAWLEAAGADGPDHDYMKRERQEFLQVLRTVKAVAWREGYSEGWLDAQDAHNMRQVMDLTEWELKTPNPYEERHNPYEEGSQ